MARSPKSFCKITSRRVSDSNARDAAVAASLALQHGCSLRVLQRAVLREEDGSPSTPLGMAIDLIIADGGER